MRGSMEYVMREVTSRISKGDDHSRDGKSPGSDPPPQNMRRLADAGASAKITGKCGETMEVYLRVDGERIAEAAFFTNGCGFSILCGHVAARLAENRTLDEAAEIEGDSILSVIGRVPQEEAHCAELAAETVRAAVHEWMLKWRCNR